MSDTSAHQSFLATSILDVAGRATLPFHEVDRDRNAGTAFWYNDLVDATPGREVIRQYLVTAEPLTRYPLGQFTLRDGLCEPAQSAGVLILPDFGKLWTRLDDIGVAIMPTVELHTHAERRGWSWTTDEITAGLAADAEEIAAIGTEPVPAYVLGHGAPTEDDADEAGDIRLPAVAAGTVARDADGVVRWDGAELPRSFGGGPVFLAIPLGDEQFRLVCAGLLLPAAGDTAREEVLTFDRLRPAVRAVTDTVPGPRRWWPWPRRKK